MRERGPDRDVAIAFLHGFMLGKSGQTRFDLEKLHKESDAFIERCDKANVRYSATIVTNGYLLDKRICADLRDRRATAADFLLVFRGVAPAARAAPKPVAK